MINIDLPLAYQIATSPAAAREILYFSSSKPEIEKTAKSSARYLQKSENYFQDFWTELYCT